MYKSDMIIVYLDMSGKSIYHLGASYIIAYLRDKGFIADIYINDGFYNFEMLVEDLLEKDPMCIGFSIYDTNFYLVREVTKRIKDKSDKKRWIIAGGPTATFSDEKVLRFDPNVDICIRHEGEEITAELIETLRNGKNIDLVNGITYRGKNGEFIRKTSKSLPHTLDVYSSPYLSGVIDVVECQKKNNMVMLVSSRGCVFGCRYCNFAAIGRHSICIHSLDRVIDEIKYIVKKGEENRIKLKIEFMDDIFTINRNRTIEFCKRIQEEAIDFEFGVQTRADFMDEELLDQLYKAGCRKISYGLESAVPRILHAMGKVNPKYDNTYIKEIEFIEKMESVVNLSLMKGIETTVNVIFGWETETKEEGLQSLEVIRKLNANRYAHNVLTYYAGTEIFNKAVGKVNDKIKQIEDNTGVPILNLNYDIFPELYSYNPYEIPHLNNDMYRYVMERRRSIIQTIMGIGFYESNFPQVILSYSSDLKYSWLLKNIGITTRVAFARKSEEANEYNWLFPLKAFANECMEYDSFNNLEKAEVVKKTKVIRGKEVYGERSKLPVVVSIKDKEDAYEFFSRNENLSKAQIIERCSTRNEDYMIEDFCRWCSDGECPAIGLKRIMIKENNNIYTCFSGKPLGRIDDDIDVNALKEKIISIFVEEYSKRGCETCDVKDTCSKCIFVDDIGREVYCEIQRNKKNLKNTKIIYKTKMMEYFYEI